MVIGISSTKRLPLRLGRRPEHQLRRQIEQLADHHGLSNVFNPSPAFVNGVWHVAFRANRGDRDSPIGGFVGPLDGSSDLVDLGIEALERGIEKVADPKLLVLDGELHVTFNTGYVAGRENALYLQRLGASPAGPQHCTLVGRRRIEKNWAFYRDATGTLRALYGLEPLSTIRHVTGRLGSDDALEFTFDAPPADAPHAFTIGSQLSLDATGGQGTLIAHRKTFRDAGRSYTGVAVRVDLSGPVPELLQTGRPLIHSIRSMRRVRNPRNPNLYSATYCSGLQIMDDGRAVIGYGVNDTEFGVATVPYGKLW